MKILSLIDGVCTADGDTSRFCGDTLWRCFLQHALGEDGVFWLFAGACVAGLIFAAVVLPETKGQSLEQIQARMGSKKPQ